MRNPQNFKVGDIVTRDGTDRQKIIETGKYGEIKVKCIQAPESGWCKIGDEETNLARRYNKIEQQGQFFETINFHTAEGKFGIGIYVKNDIENVLTRAKKEALDNFGNHLKNAQAQPDKTIKEWFENYFGAIEQ